jgi:chemotaxis regulatin CheY-phosphate phosphatase CheZ
METSQYIKQVLQEHLLSKDYQELTQQEAIQKLEQVKSTLKEILTANANQLSKAENTFFQKFFTKEASQPSTESPYFMASQKCTRHHSHYDR